MHPHVADLIAHHRLAPHPEGGHYRRIYEAQERLVHNGRERPLLTAIRCMAAASQSAIARKPGIDDLRERALTEWQRLAEAAIARNAVTFSTLGMGVLLEQGGIIDDLRAKGYTVEAPE
ncbi:cupin domain-containing protein [Flavobacterium sp. MXW15]|uniref:Cupin domain-containing protein n=1 Tax=Xanthomonas chitinilytica TaxID=2989819 RepID=A0ABT3JRF3_9XANT|nr:cupin domain-containing protein [Xanthomonas sp. H13-6]MCW4453879.1 cupin domain-containing protein [Flavobacterium sp. MXW15]MCW4471074.1 cupin domain-containing protein [Xanthomonas sp. H13-6]